METCTHYTTTDVQNLTVMPVASVRDCWYHNETNNSSCWTPVITTDYRSKAWMKFCGMMGLVVVAVIGNGCLIYTVLRHRHLRTNTNTFIVSLAAADFLFAFPTIPFYIAARSAENSLFGQPLSKVCVGTISAVSFEMTLTICTLLALTVERYMCILHPLKHRQWAQGHNVAYLIGFLWFWALFVGLLPLMGWNTLHLHNPWAQTNTSDGRVEHCTALKVVSGPYVGLIYVFHILPVCVLLPVLYTRMFVAIRKFVARKSHSSLDTDVDGDLLAERETTIAQKQRDAAVRRSSRRSLRLLLIMAVYAIFSWMPNFVWYAVATRGFTNKYMTSDMIKKIPLPIQVYNIACTLGLTNSAINPYIYGLGNVPIRKAFLKMIRHCGISRCQQYSTAKFDGFTKASSEINELRISQTRLPNISNEQSVTSCKTP